MPITAPFERADCFIPGALDEGLDDRRQGCFPRSRERSPAEKGRRTQGLTAHKPKGAKHTLEEIDRKDKEMSKRRSEEVKMGTPQGSNQWSAHPQKELASPSGARA